VTRSQKTEHAEQLRRSSRTRSVRTMTRPRRSGPSGPAAWSPRFRRRSVSHPLLPPASRFWAYVVEGARGSACGAAPAPRPQPLGQALTPPVCATAACPTSVRSRRLRLECWWRHPMGRSV